MASQEISERGDFSDLCAVDLSNRVSTADPWIATLAHELRQPLAAIVMALEELCPTCVGNPVATAARAVACDGAAHMAQVIENVLELCRCRQGKLSLRTVRVELSKIVTGAIRNVRPIMIDKNHQLTVSLPVDQVLLEAHACRFEQILTNLLVNAANYTDPGGRISLAAESAAGVLIVRIRDNGIGISQDLLPHVFDTYRQGNFPANGHRQGLGIGLALVNTLVKLHNGTIEAHSDGPGTGSEFIVRLPCVLISESAKGGDFFG